MIRFKNAALWVGMLVLLFGGRHNLSAGEALGPGIEGNITEVGGRFFIMKLDGGFIMKVFVNANTRFELKGQKSNGTYVKVGARAAVAGTSTSGGHITEALFVNVVVEAPAAPADKDKDKDDKDKDKDK